MDILVKLLFFAFFCNGTFGIDDDDILDISLELFDHDKDRVDPENFIINLQEKTNDSSIVDTSREKFFTSLDEEVFQKPLYRSFIKLLNNYERTQGIEENVTKTEKRETNRFLNIFFKTRLSVRLYEFLDQRGLAGCKDLSRFKNFIKKMWFELFSRRNNALDTSGFEHVFVGELRSNGNSVSGFHNWIQLYLEEKRGRLNYYGYTGVAEPYLYATHFEWNGALKRRASITLGGSPAYELAVFTLCHMTRPNSICTVLLRDSKGIPVRREIQSYTWRRTNPGINLKYVGTAFFIV